MTASIPIHERIAMNEGSIVLPPGFEDRTANLFMPADPQNSPNLSIARDWLNADETLSAYVDRQVQLLKSRLPGHKLLSRREERLGGDADCIIGECVEAQYRNGAQTVRQRQAAFIVAPRRALILTAASARAFDQQIENLWRAWLDSFILSRASEGHV